MKVTNQKLKTSLAWLKKYWWIVVTIAVAVGIAFSSCKIKTQKFELEKGEVKTPWGAK